MRQNLPRNVVTRLEASRVVVYALLAGAAVGLLGSGLRVVLDAGRDVLGRVVGFQPPGTPGEGGLLVTFGSLTPWGLLALPVLGAVAVILRRHDDLDPLERAVRGYHSGSSGAAPDLAGGEGRAEEAAPAASGWAAPWWAAARSLVAASVASLSGLAVGRDGPFTALGNLSGLLLERFARLTPTEARTLSLACVAAALGLVLHAPLAAAVLMVEVLYRRFEFEVEVLLPAVLASVAGYAVYGTLHGFSGLVDPSVLQSPTLGQVPLYALVALVVMACAWIVATARRALPPPPRELVPRVTVAALVALVTAGVAWYLPELLGDGTGWWQLSLSGFQGGEAAWQGLIRAALLLSVAWLALGGTVLTALSAGGLVGVGLATALPGLGLDPAVSGMVGAAAFLTTSHNVPVAATLLLAAWGGDATLPALLAATLLAHALSGEASLLASQLRGRADSPVHAIPSLPLPVGTAPAGPPEEPEPLSEERLYRVPLPLGWRGLPSADVIWPDGVQFVAVVRAGEVQLARIGQVFEHDDELVLLAPPDRFDGLAGALATLNGS